MIRINTSLLLAAVGAGILVIAGRVSGFVERAGGPFIRPEFSASPPMPRGPETLVLADFESARDLSRWALRGVELTRVREHATHGRWAGRFAYPAKHDSPAAIFDEPFERGAAPSNWTSYDHLRLDIRSLKSKQERLIVQIKDRDGHVYKQHLYLNPGIAESIAIPLDDVRPIVNLARVAQVTLFRWKPTRKAAFVVDHLRLVRESLARVDDGLSPAARAALARGEIPMAAPYVLGIEHAVEKIFRDPKRFEGVRTTAAHLWMARNEVEAFQIALFDPARELSRVQVEWTPLTRDGGSGVIEPGQISVRQVGYVRTQAPKYPVRHVGWWPDPLMPFVTLDAPAGEVQPLWVTVRTREDTPPGTYRGRVTIAPAGRAPQPIALTVTVLDFTLPATGKLKTAFGFYPARLHEAYQKYLPNAYLAWKPHMGRLKHRYFLAMLEHRLSPIWNVDPLSEPGFDRKMTQYLERGLTVFGAGKHGGTFGNNWPEEPAALNRAVAPYRGMARALRERGWLERAYIYTYDEPAIYDPAVARVARRLHEADPELRTLVVLGDLKDPAEQPEWWNDLDIICVRNTAVSPSWLDALRQSGKEIWLYASGPSHPYPTLVVDYPAITARILPWMSWKAGATGLLYWSVNYWRTNPWTEPNNTEWDQNGNGSLFYPGPDGPIDSIRLEALRDGIEDYEYLALLRDLVERVRARPDPDPARQALLERADRALRIDPAIVESMRAYTRHPQQLLRARADTAQLIQRLQAEAMR